MMPDRPDAAELLALAEKLFRVDLLPALPPDKRLEGLMIANAMGIAAREYGEAPRLRRGAARSLATLYGARVPAEGDDAAFDALSRRLAADIRAGAFDAGEEAKRLHKLLVHLTVKRLAVSNPRYLAGTQPNFSEPDSSAADASGGREPG